ncbi:mannose-1-phosphate guanylyltransferase [Vulgatibacter sp.]|uniref:mannose-1-phosphate guanylyltransferase n=1 Tax=Vulgatibacter sp. TaxID=1971226 RepID=UPI00356359F9
MATKKRIHPVILAGGSGTRFWPLSREKKPKQLLPLASDKPLVADTAARLVGLSRLEDIVTVCGRAHAPAIRRMLPEEARGGVVVEPAARNTAPAIGLAATVVAARDPKGVLLVLPSDHAILDLQAFRETVQRAVDLAGRGSLVTIGVQPTRAETGFGYIQVGAPLAKGGGHRVTAFHEKPDRERAKGYLAAGGYLWNAGMFAFRADRILEELREHLPDCAAALAKIAPSVGTAGFARAVARHFPTCPSISIDYAVMEKAQDIAVVPASFTWSDLGSFSSLPEVREADAAGNVTSGNVMLFDALQNVVLGQGNKPVALIGVSDLIVVDAGDALLVCNRDRAQEVRKVVEALRARGDGKLL